MTYSATDLSPYLGSPIYLYCFSYFLVSWQEFYYTSHDKFVDHLNPIFSRLDRYVPIHITHSEPKTSRELAQNRITVSMPRDNPVAMLFARLVPSTHVTLNIYAKHDLDTAQEVVNVWKGRVLNVDWSESEAALVCEPMMGIIKRKGPPQTYGQKCQHIRYSAQCGLNQDLWKTDATISAVSANGLVLTSAIIATKAIDWFPFGFAQRASGELRDILKQTTNTVELLLPFNGLVVGDVVSLFAGGDYDIQTCHNRFNNKLNFLGFHTTPQRNIFLTGAK